MSRTRKYLSQQFQLDKLTLKHERLEEFYLASMQGSYSPTLALAIRVLLFSLCLVILSLSSTSSTVGAYWLIYMTNWGVVIITITTGLAVAVSVKGLFDYLREGTLGSTPACLPWYLKLYWAWHSIGICVAFLITIFYYSFLFGLVDESDHDAALDVWTHGINSVVMFLLLVTSAHPSHFLHFVYPTIVLVAYLTFSLIYYYAGGLSPAGDRYIYPMLDWSNPGLATAVVFGCLGGLVVLHTIAVLISLLRDRLFRRYVIKPNKVIINT